MRSFGVSSPPARHRLRAPPQKAHVSRTPNGSSARFEGPGPTTGRPSRRPTTRPPKAIRVNSRRAGRDAYLVELRDAEIPASPAPHADQGLVLASLMEATALPGFRMGAVSVQDPTAQLAAPLLDVRAGHPRPRRLRGARRQGGASPRDLSRGPPRGGGQRPRPIGERIEHPGTARAASPGHDRRCRRSQYLTAIFSTACSSTLRHQGHTPPSRYQGPAPAVGHRAHGRGAVPPARGPVAARRPRG